MNNALYKRVPLIGILSAIGILLTYIEIPLPFMPPFMKVDVSDAASMVGLFALGLPSAILVTVIKDVVHLFVSDSLGIGEICNFLITLVYLTAFHSVRRYGTLPSYGASILSMTAAASFLNVYVLLPLYFAAFRITEAQLLAMTGAAGNPASTMAGYILLVVVPFNLVKGVMIAFVSELLRRRIPFLHQYSPAKK